MKNLGKYINRKLIQLSMAAAIIFPLYEYAMADEGNPITAVNNLGTFFSSLVSTIGAALLIWSIVNLGLAIKRRDPAATGEAVLGIAGGALIAFAPYVVKIIMGS